MNKPTQTAQAPVPSIELERKVISELSSRRSAISKLINKALQPRLTSVEVNLKDSVADMATIYLEFDRDGHIAATSQPQVGCYSFAKVKVTVLRNFRRRNRRDLRIAIVPLRHKDWFAPIETSASMEAFRYDNIGGIVVDAIVNSMALDHRHQVNSVIDTDLVDVLNEVATGRRKMNTECVSGVLESDINKHNRFRGRVSTHHDLHLLGEDALTLVDLDPGVANSVLLGHIEADLLELEGNRTRAVGHIHFNPGVLLVDKKRFCVVFDDRSTRNYTLAIEKLFQEAAREAIVRVPSEG